MRWQHAATLAVWGLAACDGSGPAEPPPRDRYAVAAQCSSGITSDPNESESPDMMPGRACNACHARENAASGEADAPIYAFAGTVFPTGHEPDDCTAPVAEGAQVIVTDASGAIFTAAVNRVGNFLLEGVTVAPPFRAKVVFQGRELAMKTAQVSGDCNQCHSAAGEQLAKGRIPLP